MWDGCTVFDGFDVEPRGLQRRDRAFASGARPLDPDFNILDAKLHGALGSLLSRTLAGEWSALATTLELTGAGAGPTKGVATTVRDGDQCVVERRLDKDDGRRHVSSCFSFLRRLLFGHGRFLSK